MTHLYTLHTNNNKNRLLKYFTFELIRRHNIVGKLVLYRNQMNVGQFGWQTARRKAKLGP